MSNTNSKMIENMRELLDSNEDTRPKHLYENLDPAGNHIVSLAPRYGGRTLRTPDRSGLTAGQVQDNYRTSTLQGTCKHAT